METLMQQYNVSIERETRKFIEEYGGEFIANLNEEDIDAFAEILAERVDLQQNITAQEA